jgi:hypothetical protein
VSGFAFLTGPSLRDHPFLQQNQTFILVSFLALGCAVAFTGLSKIRHGAWQRWTWRWPRQRFGLRQSSGAFDLSSGEGKAPEGWRSPRPAAIRPAHGEGESLRAARSQITRPFRSPAQAQFWFEWHARAGKLFYYVCGLSGAALLLMSIVAIRMGSLSEGDTNGLCIFLLAVPLFIHLCHGITPERNLPTFIATHPLISGDIVMAKLKTAALSSFLSWVVTVAMLCVVPLLGDVPTMLDQLSFPASYQLRVRSLLPVIVLALMFLTWRFVAADLYFGWSRTAWSVRVAALKIYVVLALGFLVAYLARSPRFEATFFNTVPFLLAFLILLKLVLAQWAFRASLKRQLLARSTMLKYLAIWLALAAALLIPTVLSFHHEPWILSLALGIILLLPLARIGFSPLALALGRHR